MGGRDQGAPPGRRGLSTGAIGWDLPLRDFDPARFLAFSEARAVAGAEAVEGNTLRWVARPARRPVLISVTFAAGRRISIVASAKPSVSSRQLSSVVSRRLGLDTDLRAFRRMARTDAILAPLVRRRPGLRLPQAADPFEATIRAIVGQLISVPAATTVLGRLVARFGTSTPWPAWRGFPEPATLAGADQSALRRIGLTGAKAQALVAVARAAPHLDWAGWRARPAEAQAALEALPGIGPWTAGYVRFRGLGDPDVFLATDLGVRRALAARGVSPADVEKTADRWRPWRSHAMLHLWAGLTD